MNGLAALETARVRATERAKGLTSLAVVVIKNAVVCIALSSRHRLARAVPVRDRSWRHGCSRGTSGRDGEPGWLLHVNVCVLAHETVNTESYLSKLDSVCKSSALALTEIGVGWNKEMPVVGPNQQEMEGLMEVELRRWN